MKKAIFGVLFLLAAAGMAFAATETYETLPGSNQSTPVIAYAVTPAAVAISSVTPTAIDTAVNTALAAQLGAAYKRTRLEVQTYTTTAVNCGYSTAVTTQPAGGFLMPLSGNPITVFPLGKAVHVYCQGIASTTTFIVGGLGFK